MSYSDRFEVVNHEDEMRGLELRHVDDATFAVLDWAAGCPGTETKPMRGVGTEERRGHVKVSQDRSWWQLTATGIALYRAGCAERGMR